MSRKLLLLIFCFGLLTFCTAQYKYGIKGGMTQSLVTETPILTGTEYTHRTGFQFGLFLEKVITTNLSFRPALQYTQKGYQSVVGNSGGPFYWSKNLRTAYLEIPFEILQKFSITKTSIFYVGTGPVVSYGLKGRLKASVVFTDNNQQLHSQISTDNNIFKNNLDRQFDFGWNFNIGVQSCRMLFNAAYNHGITNVIKGDNQSLRNRSFAFSVGYLLW